MSGEHLDRPVDREGVLRYGGVVVDGNLVCLVIAQLLIAENPVGYGNVVAVERDDHCVELSLVIQLGIEHRDLAGAFAVEVRLK